MRALDTIQGDPELSSLTMIQAPLVDVEIRGVPALKFLGDIVWKWPSVDDLSWEVISSIAFISPLKRVIILQTGYVSLEKALYNEIDHTIDVPRDIIRSFCL